MSPSHGRHSAPARSEDDIISVFLRIPPDDPARLLRASLVCKDWRRILTGPEFCRLYREFHGTPPILGFVVSGRYQDSDFASRFIPTSAFRLSAGLDFYPRNCKAADSRHGRILVEIEGDDDLSQSQILPPGGYVVWDPITNGRWGVPIPRMDRQSWTGAVLCAKEHCDHLGCHGPPFLVAMVSSFAGTTSAWVYSSESGLWSDSITLNHWDLIASDRTILVGNTLHFPYVQGSGVLQYKLGEQELSVIDLPMVDWEDSLVFISVEDDDVLVFAGLDPPGTRLSLWSTEAGTLSWTQRTVIDLEKLLPPRAFEPKPHLWEHGYKHYVSCFAEGVVFLSTVAGLFKVELNSGRTKKVAEIEMTQYLIPLISFYTPDHRRMMPRP